jgi:MoaA/NifB/PqqE/SkfB family radical SAM enzyme
MQISLDGSNAEINDAIRGKGRFSKTLAGIDIALKQGFSVYLAIVLLKQNLDDIEDYLAFAANLGVRGVKVQTLIESGLALTNQGDISLERDAILRKLADLWREKQKFRGILEVMLPLIPEVVDQLDEEPEYYNRDASCLGCQPGLSTVRVNSRGEVRACGGMVDAPSIGNVREMPLQQIWKESSELVKWRNATAVSEGETSTSCGSLCGKGCRSRSAPAFAREAVGGSAAHR